MNQLLSGTTLLFFLLLPVTQAQAQQRAQSSRVDYTRQAAWVEMMEDTNANYFEVENAFQLYFSRHEMPEEAEAELGEYRKQVKYTSRRQQRRIIAENKLRMNVKRYHLWQEQTLPFVQADGRILSPSERLRIHQVQQQTH